MNVESEDRLPAQDPRVLFAAERTLLAWIRTGLALMGFGFVVARFGLFLNEIALTQAVAPPRRHGLSIWVGTTLVVLGVIVNVWSGVRHWRTIKRYQRGDLLVFHPFSLGVLLAIVLGIVGLLMAAYLVFGLGAAS